MVADHGLAGGYHEKLNGFKAYLMALVSTIGAQPSHFGEIASHIVLNVASPVSPIKESEPSRLVSDLKKQLRTGGLHARSVEALLLWPFQVAARLFPLRNAPQKLAATAQELTTPQKISELLYQR
jgi:hypothetical protein